MQLVIFVHDGLRCAMPLEQVRSADAGSSEKLLWLFRDEAPKKPARTPRYLQVGDDERRVPCSEVHVREVPDDAIRVLTPVLQAAVGRDHVRALVFAEDAPAWLVDLS